ncbi:MAG: FAD-dependent oxidoreductase [Armatimonadetes bacterium]|nr:FAD-dependent oxidoreductase [Armatimonadota bacterium]
MSKKEMNSGSYELVIVGAGIVGLSTALSAAKSGVHSILCLDQHGVANSVGASGDGLRLFRVSYFEHPAYVPLLREAIEAWKALGDDLYVPVGGFYAGPQESELIWGALLSAHRHNIPHDEMTAAEAMRRFPQFHLPTEYVGFFEPQAGFVRAARATRAMAAACERKGVKIQEATVAGLEPIGNRWLVRGDDWEVSANQVIVAAGNGTGALVPHVAPHVTSRTHTLLWIEPASDIWREAPGFGIMNRAGEMLYGFPALDDMPGVKIGAHHHLPSRTLEDQMADLVVLLAQYLQHLKKNLLSRKTCAYDMSPDGNFIIGRVEPGLTVACGFSGHGFKFGSVIGDIVWQAANTGLPDELGFLDVLRYPWTT